DPFDLIVVRDQVGDRVHLEREEGAPFASRTDVETILPGPTVARPLERAGGTAHVEVPRAHLVERDGVGTREGAVLERVNIEEPVSADSDQRADIPRVAGVMPPDVLHLDSGDPLEQ